MKYTRGRRLVSQPRRYESLESVAQIEFDTKDIPSGSTAAEWADQVLTDLLAPEVEAAAAVTDGDRSFIFDYRYTDTDTESAQE